MTQLPHVLSKFTVIKQRGAWHEAKCPAHDDKRASLGVAMNDNGWVVLQCQAGCEREAILERVGLRVSDLGPPRQYERKERTITKTYDYFDENGTLLYQVCRLEPKAFLQRRPRGDGSWEWRKGERQVLYNLPMLIEFRKALEHDETKRRP